MCHSARLCIRNRYAPVYSREPLNRNTPEHSHICRRYAPGNINVATWKQQCMLLDATVHVPVQSTLHLTEEIIVIVASQEITIFYAPGQLNI